MMGGLGGQGGVCGCVIPVWALMGVVGGAGKWV